MTKFFETVNCINICHNNNSWLAVRIVESFAAYATSHYLKKINRKQTFN